MKTARWSKQICSSMKVLDCLFVRKKRKKEEETGDKRGMVGALTTFLRPKITKSESEKAANSLHESHGRGGAQQFSGLCICIA